jgi:hypothetical protein
VLLHFEDGLLTPGAVHHFAVEPRRGTHVEPASLAFTGIDLADPIATRFRSSMRSASYSKRCDTRSRHRTARGRSSSRTTPRSIINS